MDTMIKWRGTEWLVEWESDWGDVYVTSISINGSDDLYDVLKPYGEDLNEALVKALIE